VFRQFQDARLILVVMREGPHPPVSNTWR
jgi:hypothetical protein